MNVAQSLAWPSAAARLVVQCLGRFRLDGAGGGQPRTRKARAMLACLALGGRPMTRDSLASLLWSERAPAQARSSVRQTLFELQHPDDGEAPVLAVSRGEIAIRPELVVTDLELIRSAAESGDWRRLATLLEDSEPGLLIDLDGLDPEFDCWLRTERAAEPSRTFAAVVEAAERCRAEAGPRVALELLSEIVRLDPANESAARIMFAIDHELGDKPALHRHFQLLSDRLREDYDAEPSDETLALFKRLANGHSAAPATERRAADGRPEIRAAEPAPAPPRRSPALRPLLVVAALLVAASAAFAAWMLGERAAPAAPPRVLVAVLPFDQQPGGDGFLASGLWEHTRAALTRNGALRVLGRSTTAALAGEQAGPDEYRKRFRVTHLLEGTVRRTGDRILVSVSLSQTSDGVAVWQAMFTGRMGEPLALQDRIANGIEGRLRGRLAPDGGRRAEQIATMPEVYSLYSEARELIGSRRRENMGRAEAIMRRAVVIDPNYAPAWSLLAAAISFNGRRAVADADRRRESTRAVRRALALAPNLAQAHATLALIEGGSSPAAERALRRAVALDPSYAEAWNWLGNALHGQYRHEEALAAYQRAAAIDPLLNPAVQNLGSTAAEMGEDAIIDRLLRDLDRARASPVLIGSIQAKRLSVQGDYSGATQLLQSLGLDSKGHSPPTLWMNWFEALTGSGQFDLLHSITDCPDWYAPLLRGEVLPPKFLEGKPVSPEEFWTSLFFSHPASRAMVRHGKSRDLVRLYRAEFRDVEDFVSRTSRRGLLAGLAPTLAFALAREGAAQEASYLLAAAANQLEPAVKRTGNRAATAELAAIRAAQGEREQALALLGSAVRGGWLPDARQTALDLAQEPAFAGLRSDPRFEAMRKRILAHVARERAELRLSKA